MNPDLYSLLLGTGAGGGPAVGTAVVIKIPFRQHKKKKFPCRCGLAALGAVQGRGLEALKLRGGFGIAFWRHR